MTKLEISELLPPKETVVCSVDSIVETLADKCSGHVELALMNPDIFSNAKKVPKIERGLTRFFLRMLSETLQGEKIIELATLKPENSFLMNGEQSEDDEDIAFWLGECFCVFLKTQKCHEEKLILNENELRAFIKKIIKDFNEENIRKHLLDILL